MNYFLIGMPGCGKTTLGKELSTTLKLTYVDLDEWIVEKEGKTILEIFEEFGQDYFREKETEALKIFINSSDNALISTGGGTPCFNNNMKLINDAGTSIFINASIEEIFKRLRHGKQNRPLVQGLSDEELYNKIESMLTERLPFYNQAKIKVTGDNLSIDDLLNALKMKA
jgi:shikimate kinase